MKIRSYLCPTIYVNKTVKKKDFYAEVEREKPKIIEQEDKTLYIKNGVVIAVMKPKKEKG